MYIKHFSVLIYIYISNCGTNVVFPHPAGVVFPDNLFFQFLVLLIVLCISMDNVLYLLLLNQMIMSLLIYQRFKHQTFYLLSR